MSGSGPAYSVGSCVVKVSPGCIIGGDPVPLGSHGRVLSWERAEAVVLWNPGSTAETPDVLLPAQLSRECAPCGVHPADVEFPVRRPLVLHRWYKTMGNAAPGWLARIIFGADAEGGPR